MIPTGSRKDEDVISIEVGEERTACTHCGSRTAILQVNLDGSRIEECLHCSQRFLVTDAIEDEETGEMVSASEPKASILDKILSEFENKPEPTFELEGVVFRVADIKIDTYRSSSFGWANKADNGVRVTHIPTGLAASNHDDRSQHKNKAAAMKQLAWLIKRQRPDLAVPEASQEELNHLFGIKPSPYPEFGSY